MNSGLCENSEGKDEFLRTTMSMDYTLLTG